MSTRDAPADLSPSAERILEIFATGELVPGAGSAVALTAGHSASMICAVARLTQGKAERGSPPARARYRPFAARAGQIDAEARACLTELTRYVQDDARRVAVVIEQRRRRDAASDARARDEAARAAREALVRAGEIPRRVAAISERLEVLARELAQDGYRAAAADATAAASLAKAAIEGARALLSEDRSRGA